VGGAVILILSALLYTGAYWADIEFLRPLSAIGIAFGLCWFLGGWENVRRSGGALGFLLFTIPWPTTVMGRLQLPLQITSSAYAAIFAGILGIPVHRDGVTLSILPDPARPPTYVILVAQQCSGLTSLIVLLAIGYLVAYFTPVHWSKRALLFFITAPLALLTNAARLTFILMAGASHGAAVAQWVHDHEQPVLVFACTMGLMVIRAIILRGERSRKPVAIDEEAEEEWETEEAPKPRFPRAKAFLGRIRLTVAIAALLFALAGSAYARRPDPGEGAYNDFLSGLALPYRDWAQESLPLTDAERAMLQPDAQLLRRYTSPGHGFVEIAVIAGRRKKTVHTPDFCLVGGGWDTLSQHDVVLNVAGRKVPAVQALLLRNGERMMATYFFTDGDTSTRSLPQFQLRQIMRRLGGHASLGAMVRILASAGGSPEGAERRSDDFAESTLPAVFAALTRAEK
jgi:EpsI family protein